MKRSRRVVLLMMGAAAIGGTPTDSALAGPCDPIDPRLLRPGEADRRRVNCARLGGFGSSGHRVHHYFHGPGG